MVLFQAGEMALQVKALAARPKNPNYSGSHIVKGTNSQKFLSDLHTCAVVGVRTCVRTYTCMHTN